MTTRYEKEKRRKGRRSREAHRRRAYQRPAASQGQRLVKAFCALVLAGMVIYILVTGDLEILDRDRDPSSLFD